MRKSTAYSLLVFEPGGGAPRFPDATKWDDLARRGYVVATDYPHHALAVAFPDGHAKTGLNKTLRRHEVESVVIVRAQDLSFVIDELGRH